MTNDPRFRELVGEDLSAEEAERLGRVHDLLVEAGPLPELPLSLATPSIDAPAQREHAGMFELLPRRRVGAALALAAAIALIAFLGGYLAGYRKGDKAAAPIQAAQRVTLHGVGGERQAVALIEVGHKDENGNLPMRVTVQGLDASPSNGYYTLALTKHGKPVVTCGTFRIRSATASTTIPMIVAYDVADFDGWVVTEYRHGRKAAPVVLSS